jgi:alkanesulfonate monooxygenase SsuD/methylene tetrahydromethanopterin reductase-like flavin-dependent oxidoreductase (luciferase family)
MVGLARLASATERVAIGTAVLVLPLYPPALVAKQVADLDRASGGRVILGVGVGGEYPQEFQAMHVPRHERGARTTEIIPLLRRFWTGNEVTHDGPHYPMRDIRIHPTPLQPGGPPIIVAGRQEAAMRRAARIGDGWLPYMYSPHRYAESVKTINLTAEDAGRELGRRFHWCIWVFLNINSDGNVAREEAAKGLGGFQRRDLSTIVDHIAAAGTVGEVRARVRDFYDAGARHFVFLPVTAGAPETPVLDQLLAEVVPDLHEHASRGQSDAVSN